MDAHEDSEENCVRSRAHLAVFRTLENAVAPRWHEWHTWWDTVLTCETTIIP